MVQKKDWANVLISPCLDFCRTHWYLQDGEFNAGKANEYRVNEATPERDFVLTSQQII